jgi:hypothetical protein
MTTVHLAEEAAALNNLPPQELNRKLHDLTTWYVHFHNPASHVFSFGDASKGASATTLAEKLVSRGAIVSQYRNGSYVSQANTAWGELYLHEAADLEKTAPLAIGTFWPGHKQPSIGSDEEKAARLAKDARGSDTTLEVFGAARFKPAGAPDTWPYVPSRGTGAAPGNVYSENTHDFVSWVRIENEIMRIRKVALQGDRVVISVDRGYFGTSPASHVRDTRVMSPVYVGSTAASKSDSGLAGSPPVDDTGRALRYAIKVWQPDAVKWIADQIKLTLANGKPAPYVQGYNGVWLDITGCASYNTADAYGKPVIPWDDPHGTLMTPDMLGEYNIEKLARFKKYFSRELGYPEMKWMANNLAAGREGTAACCNHVIAEGGFDGAALEYWLRSVADWEALMAQHFLIQANNWPAIYWVKESSNPRTGPSRYRRFTYGALLLAYRPSANRFQYGSGFGLVKPEELYFWNWGTPEGTPNGLGDLPVKNCGSVKVYRRNFENGFVLVNSSQQNAVCDLGGEYYDLLQKDSTGQPTTVNRVSVAASDARFLMKGVRADDMR